MTLFIEGPSSAYAPSLLDDNGVDARVVQAQVDMVLGANVSEDQRKTAYELIQGHMDEIPDEAWTNPDYLPVVIPGYVAKLLREHSDIPLVGDPRMIAAVDSQLPWFVQSPQHRQAYEAAQAWLDQNGGIGLRGTAEKWLPLRLGQVLRDKDVDTLFDQAVVDAVDKVIGSWATPEQQQKAYDVVKSYVVGDDRIYIPPKELGDLAVKALRENHIPTQIDTALLNSPAFEALSSADQELIWNKLTYSSPDNRQLPEAFKHLIEDSNFQKLTPEERTAMLSSRV